MAAGLKQGNRRDAKLSSIRQPVIAKKRKEAKTTNKVLIAVAPWKRLQRQTAEVQI